MTYLPTKPPAAPSALTDADTITVVQSGVSKTATLATFKAYVGTASTGSTGSTGATGGSTGSTGGTTGSTSGTGATSGTPAASPAGTLVTTVGPTISDGAGNLYAISSAGLVTNNGVPEDGTAGRATTANVVALYWDGTSFYQKNNAGAWYKKTSATVYAGPVSLPESAEGTDVTTVGPVIVDAASNVYSINSAGRVVLNNVPEDGTNGARSTANVTELYYHAPVVNGPRQIYQKNATDWYTATSATAAYTGPASNPKTTAQSPAAPTTIRQRGINILTLGNGAAGSQYYKAPADSHLDYFAGKGIKFARVELLWERLQRTLNGPLDTEYAGMIDDMLARMASRGMCCVLDVHNYMAYYTGSAKGGSNGTRQEVGSSAVPNSALYDLWNKMVTRWKDSPAVFAWGLMNEPTFSNPFSNWQTVAQQLVTNIRAIENNKFICCAIWGYSNINAIGSGQNDTLDVNDPAGKLLYEIHGGLEADALDTYLLKADGSTTGEGSGDYNGYVNNGPTDGPSGLRMSTALNQSRVTRVVNWANSRTHKPYGIFWGEVGIPGYDIQQPTNNRWTPMLQDFFSRFPDNWSFAYWMDGAGAFGDSLYNTSCGPINQNAAGQSCEVAGTYTDRPMIPLLQAQAALSTPWPLGSTGSTGSTGATGGATAATGATGATAANAISNPTFAGAVAGTPGTLPTRWGQQDSAGLSHAIVGTGTAGGATYIDLRVYGTSTAGDSQFFPEVGPGGNGFAAATGQTWKQSYTWQVVGGSLANIDRPYTQFNESGSGGAYIAGAGYDQPALSTTATNYAGPNFTLSDAGVAFLKLVIGFHSTAGAVDVTIRFSAPVVTQVS